MLHMVMMQRNTPLHGCIVRPRKSAGKHMCSAIDTPCQPAVIAQPKHHCTEPSLHDAIFVAFLVRLLLTTSLSAECYLYASGSLLLLLQRGSLCSSIRLCCGLTFGLSLCCGDSSLLAPSSLDLYCRCLLSLRLLHQLHTKKRKRQTNATIAWQDEKPTPTTRMLHN